MSATVLSEVGAHTTNIVAPTSPSPIPRACTTPSAGGRIGVGAPGASETGGSFGSGSGGASGGTMSGVGEGFESGSAGLGFEFAALVIAISDRFGGFGGLRASAVEGGLDIAEPRNLAQRPTRTRPRSIRFGDRKTVASPRSSALRARPEDA